MPETEKPHSTPAFNRRAVITGAAAAASIVAVPPIAASQAIPAVAAPARSPEFIAWQKAWRECEQAMSASDDGCDDPLVARLHKAHWDAVDALIQAIDAKDDPTLADALELAAAMQGCCYDDEDGEIDGGAWIGATTCEIEHALVRVVLRVGGIDV